MRAVQFVFSYPRYIYTQAAGRVSPKAYYGPRSCIALRDVPEPGLRGPHWVKLRSVLSGFCGSDLGAILLHDNPTVQAFASFPFTFGHENCSVVEEVGSAVQGIERGERVTIIPFLSCRVRGIEDLCGACLKGHSENCENFAEGALPPGLDTGYCKGTGGGWSKYYLAHETQVFKVPESLSDEQVATIEPLASAMHPMLTAPPECGQKVLVIGAGVIGLGLIASIRALGIDCHVTAVEPVALNAGKAREFGADEVIDPAAEDVFERTARITGAKVYKPMLSQKLCMGGFDRVYDCVGSADTLNQAFRVAAGHGKVVLIGIHAVGKLDLTPLWLKGLHLIGNHGHGLEDYRGNPENTYEIIVDLMSRGKLDISALITHRFTLDRYAEAIDVNMHKAANDAIKTVFDLTGE